MSQLSGKWEQTGPPILLVSQTSATYVCDTSIPINRNHSEIVKFPPQDTDYEHVLSELERLRERDDKDLDVCQSSHLQSTEDAEARQSLTLHDYHVRHASPLPILRADHPEAGIQFPSDGEDYEAARLRCEMACQAYNKMPADITPGDRRSLWRG